MLVRISAGESIGHLGEPGRRAGVADDVNRGRGDGHNDQQHPLFEQKAGVEVCFFNQPPQPFAKGIKTDDGDEKGHCRGKDDERLGIKPAVAAGQHRAPFRHIGHDLGGKAERVVPHNRARTAADEDADESEPAQQQQHRAKLKKDQHQELRQEVRQHMAHDHTLLVRSDGARALDIGHPANNQDFTAHVLRDFRPADQRKGDDEDRQPLANVEGIDDDHAADQHRHGHDHAAAAHDKAIDALILVPAGQAAQHQPDDDPRHGDEGRRNERIARAVKQHAQNIIAIFIRAQRVLGGWIEGWINPNACLQVEMRHHMLAGDIRVDRRPQRTEQDNQEKAQDN